MRTKYIDLIDQTFDFPQNEFNLREDRLFFHGIDLMRLINEYGTPLKFNYLPQISNNIQRAKGWFWGTVAGFTSFISHAGAPPFQVYMLPQQLPKAEFAGTATIVFAVINAAKIIPYQNLRPYSVEGLSYAAALVPFALAGALSGAYLTRRVSQLWFYRLVQVSLFGVSIKLLVDAIRG